jgi:hypothetical protein
MSEIELVDIQTEYGPIQGYVNRPSLGLKYFTFNRIPYMKPPVGKLRFRDPQPPEPWTEKLDCTVESEPFCNMNFLTAEYEGQLDSMFINVYTNNIKPSKSYPVMVWVRFFFCFLRRFENKCRFKIVFIKFLLYLLRYFFFIIRYLLLWGRSWTTSRSRRGKEER